MGSAKTGLTNYAAGKALESIANSGLTRKLAMVFTHMDMASESGRSQLIAYGRAITTGGVRDFAVGVADCSGGIGPKYALSSKPRYQSQPERIRKYFEHGPVSYAA